MDNKLTITIEEDIINKAKDYAKARNRSLSAIIEGFLVLLVHEQDMDTISISPEVASLKGSFKFPSNDFNYKIELEKRLTDKYL